MSLLFYREESKKIFTIIYRYAKLVEKAGCDEAFLDVTKEVESIYKSDPPDYTSSWNDAYFMSFPKGEGAFTPENIHDQKLWIANRIAIQLRNSIFEELGYRASAGISHNKTCAKIASSQNKPNAQTVVPIRYLQKAMGSTEISKVRFCGGAISETLNSNDISTFKEV